MRAAHRGYREHSLAENRSMWSARNWSRAGEEWTESPEWKATLVDKILLAEISPGGVVPEVGPERLGLRRGPESDLAPTARRSQASAAGRSTQCGRSIVRSHPPVHAAGYLEEIAARAEASGRCRRPPCRTIGAAERAELASAPVTAALVAEPRPRTRPRDGPSVRL